MRRVYFLLAVLACLAIATRDGRPAARAALDLEWATPKEAVAQQRVVEPPQRVRDQPFELQVTPSIASADTLGAGPWRAAGFTGQGVRLAVVDTGFAGYQAQLGVTLPRQVQTRSFRSDGRLDAGSEHGTLAARIVAGIAPRAELYLVNFATVAELGAAVDYLIAERVQIVSFSLGFVHNGPGDGTGPVNEIVSRAAASGAVWTVAAGNWAQQHWSGMFTDRDGDSIHEFAPGVEDSGRQYRAGDLITVSVRWDEPWGRACTDYDLELFGPDGGVVRAARDLQDCRGDPVEGLQVLATRDGRYRVRVIQSSAGAPRRLELLVLGSPDRSEGMEFAMAGASLAEPADNPSVVSVGAVTSTPPLQVARFSSRGPTTDGRAKPEVVAPTGRATGSESTFSGTSAAAPHVAGALALMLEAFPNANARDLLALLRARAVDLPPLGPDAESGAGMVQLGGLTGLGPLLPAGAENATLSGPVPGPGGMTVLRYRGPDGYPARFAHLLLEEREPVALFRFDAAQARFETHILGAPAFVNTLATLRDGNLIFVRFAE